MTTSCWKCKGSSALTKLVGKNVIVPFCTLQWSPIASFDRCETRLAVVTASWKVNFSVTNFNDAVPCHILISSTAACSWLSCPEKSTTFSVTPSHSFISIFRQPFRLFHHHLYIHALYHVLITKIKLFIFKADSLGSVHYLWPGGSAKSLGEK